MIYRFEDFEVDIEQVELRRGGARVPVEPQVFAVLRVLLDHRDRMVSKDELIDAVWAGRVVSESALSSRIKSARRALGDSGVAQRLIRTIHGHGFRFVGSVSGAAEPRELVPGAAMAQVAAVMARPMVAVFPFGQEVPEPRERYFVDGLAEDLMAELAAWRWFPILSRHAAFDPGRSALPVAQRAAALGARYAISGHLHRSDTQARLSLELIDVATGAQLWSARFERDLDGLVAMQAQIAATVISHIAPELKAAERRRILRKAPADLTAWDLTQKALWVLNQPSQTDFAEALVQLETATKMDPAAAMPWSLISLIRYETLLKGWVGGDAGSLGRHVRSMFAAARRALEIDPANWMGHSLASIGALWTGSPFAAARFHAEQALDLNPSAGLAHHFAGCVSGFGGDLETAISVQTQAFRVDPDYLHADVLEADLGLWRFLKGDLRIAQGHLERSIAQNPDNLRARQRLVALLGYQGAERAAQSQLADLVERGGPLTAEYVTATYPLQRPEHSAMLAAGLQRAGVGLS